MKGDSFPRLLQGRVVTRDDLETVRWLVSRDPRAPLVVLARDLCHPRGWYSPGGRPKETSAKALLEKLGRAGLVTLPLYRGNGSGGRGASQKVPHTPAGDPRPPRQATLQELLPLDFELVDQYNKSALWNEFIERYHYLDSSHLFGARAARVKARRG